MGRPRKEDLGAAGRGERRNVAGKLVFGYGGRREFQAFLRLWVKEGIDHMSSTRKSRPTERERRKGRGEKERGKFEAFSIKSEERGSLHGKGKGGLGFIGAVG